MLLLVLNLAVLGQKVEHRPKALAVLTESKKGIPLTSGPI